MKKVNTILIIPFMFLMLLSNLKLFAQFHDKKGGGIPDPQLSQKDNDYLDRQAKVFLDTIQSIIAEFPAIGK